MVAQNLQLFHAFQLLQTFLLYQFVVRRRNVYCSRNGFDYHFGEKKLFRNFFSDSRKKAGNLSVSTFMFSDFFNVLYVFIIIIILSSEFSFFFLHF